MPLPAKRTTVTAFAADTAFATTITTITSDNAAIAAAIVAAAAAAAALAASAWPCHGRSGEALHPADRDPPHQYQ